MSYSHHRRVIFASFATTFITTPLAAWTLFRNTSRGIYDPWMGFANLRLHSGDIIQVPLEAWIKDEGQQSAFPKLKFIANRLKQERLVEQGRRETRPWARRGSLQTIMSEEDLRSLLVNEVGAGITTEDETEIEDEVGSEDGTTAVVEEEDEYSEGSQEQRE